MVNALPLNAVMRLLSSGDVVWRGARNAIRKRATSHLDYHFGNGFSAPPVQIDIKITNACNLRCKMCAQWGETGYNLSRPSPEIRETVPLESYKKLIDDVSSVKPWIYIWGGEPFLYPDLLPLLAYIKERGLTVSVVTNGTRLEKRTDRLVEIGTDFVMFSIDGPRDTHDNVRGYRGSFEKSVAGIKAIQAYKRELGRTKPHIVLVSVVTSDNQHNLDEVYELAEEVQADLMITLYGWYQTQQSGMQQTAYLKENLDVTPWSWHGYLWSVVEIDPGAVAETVRRIKRRRWSFPYRFFPDLDYDEIPRFYREHDNTFGFSKCLAPWVMAEVMPNGDVVTCRDYPDIVVGNIKDDSLLDIWNRDPMRRFRGTLKEKGLMPICSRCHGLYGC